MSSSVGSFSGAVTSYKQGKETKKMYKRQSVYVQREAELMLEKRDEEIAAVRSDATEALSTAKSRYGKSGVAGYEGSSAEVMAEMERTAADQLASMEYWKQKEYEGYQIQRTELRRAGKLAMKAGQVGAWSGSISGGITVASSIFGGAMGSGGFAAGSAGSYAHSFLGS
jgi:hypothetical protein